MSLKLRGCILNVPYDAFAVAVEVACFIIYSLTIVVVVLIPAAGPASCSLAVTLVNVLSSWFV